MVYDWDWERAESSHLRAVELGPGLSQVHINYAYLLACRGVLDEAVSEAHRAEQLDPLSPTASQQVGMMLYLAGRFDESIAQFENTIRLNPHYWFAYLRLAQALMAIGDFDRGIEVMQRAIELAGPKTPRNGKHMLASLYARAGKREQAIAILEELEERQRNRLCPSQ